MVEEAGAGRGSSPNVKECHPNIWDVADTFEKWYFCMLTVFLSEFHPDAGKRCASVLNTEVSTDSLAESQPCEKELTVPHVAELSAPLANESIFGLPNAVNGGSEQI
jgi:hypothetical protein